MPIDQALALLREHGVLTLSLALFAKRLGIPLPALPFLLLAGAQGAQDGVFALAALLAGSLASVLADGLWFVAGRRFGRSVLAFTCRISLSPGTCIRKSELAFARRGALAVLLAKFIPGVAGLAPPLAGALGMRSGQFLLLNTAGTILWVGSGLAAGLVLHRQVDWLLGWLQVLGSAALPVVAGGLAAYLAWLLARRLAMMRLARQAPRIEPQHLAEKLARGEKVLLVDVRGGAGLRAPARLPGALSISDDAGLERLADLAGSGELVMYCDCPHDSAAALAVLSLARRGAPARVLAGGFRAWVAAGLPVQEAGDDLG